MSIQSISPETLQSWIKNQQVIIIDVREPAEYASDSIDQAINVPLKSINESALPNNDDKNIVLHCQSGMRSSQACDKLIKENPQLELYNLEGGIMAWRAAGYATKQLSTKKILPLDRQVQLTIGLMVFVFSLLAYFVTPLFFLITAFFGLGLTFAGLTGFCGLAKVMIHMPWNQRKGG